MCRGNKHVAGCDRFAELLVLSKNPRNGCIVFGQIYATVVGSRPTNPGKRDCYSTVALPANHPAPITASSSK